MTLAVTRLSLIKEFEGLRLDAYADPIHGWDVPTIGYGTTKYSNGEAVRRGDHISQDKAEAELSHYVENRIIPKLSAIPHWNEMSPRMHAALISFAYNVGEGFYGNGNFQTITRRLKNKEWDKLPETLLMYRNPGSSAEEGLRRRRTAEGAEWLAGMRELNGGAAAPRAAPVPAPAAASASAPGGSFTAEKFVDFFKYFKAANPRHLEAVKKLAGMLPAGALNDNAEWVKTYRTAVPATAETPHASGEIKLNVRYFSQRDSGFHSQATRMCFSSSNAMLASFLNPDILNKANSDDEYLKTVLLHGDTIDPAAQTRALKDYGIIADRLTTLDWEDLDNQLEKGRPVPIGILHHGPVSAPSGGGHWIVVVGRAADGSFYYVHDPYGEMDLVNGEYDTAANGAYLKYSKKNLGPRWMPDGRGSGWGMIVKRMT